MRLTLDSPPGRLDRCLSGVTGGLLEYFTPHPLSLLIESCASFEQQMDDSSVLDSSSGAVIAGCVARREEQCDPELCGIYYDIAIGNSSLANFSSLIGMANKISGKRHGLRQELVYTGAPIASAAQHIYAPHNLLPHMMEDCVLGMQDFRGCHPYLAGCMIGYYCLQMHPFKDGNGRWARAVVMSGQSGSSPTFDSALCGLMFSSCKKYLAETVWPDCKQAGLRKFLDYAVSFRSAAIERCAWVFAAASGVMNIRKEFKGNAIINSAVRKLYSEGRLGPHMYKQKYRDEISDFINLVRESYPIYVHGNYEISCQSSWDMIYSACSDKESKINQ